MSKEYFVFGLICLFCIVVLVVFPLFVRFIILDRFVKAEQLNDNDNQEATQFLTRNNFIATDIPLHFEETTEWLNFNKNYNEMPVRNFRFKYPPAFRINNVDSGSVVLQIEEDDYASIEEILPLSRVDLSKDKNEEIKFYYADRNRLALDDIANITFETLTIRAGTTCYKFERKLNDYYLCDIDKKGIEIFIYKTIPDQIVYKVIHSIEFKEY
jgi:hypothetical protein